MKINSEIAPLKRAILHRPDLSLRHLTPNNCESLLFDDVLWVEKANQEHRFFTEALKAHGVEVHLLHDLMSETINQAEGRDWLLTKLLQQLHFDHEPQRVLHEFLMALDDRTLTTYLLGGLALSNIDDQALKSYLASYQIHSEFILSPLPNHLFTRDTSCWIDNGVSINPMQFPARRRETLNMAAIYRYHPLFAQSNFHVWYDGSDETLNLPSIEGGDVLVINDHTILVGLSERTTFQAVTLLAKALFKLSQINKVIAVDIPKVRASMHLDTVMTMADIATFCLALPHNEFRSWTITAAEKPEALFINQNDNFLQTVAQALDVDSLNLITPCSDKFTREREQWNDASNLLAIAPGKVVVYDRNTAMNQRLRQAGLELIEIPGSELSRGRGGARCMSCPIERDRLNGN